MTQAREAALDPDLQPFVLRSSSGLEAAVIPFGATWVRLRAPDRDGRPGDVVLALADLADYRGRHPYLGSTLGRHANRIGAARFVLDGCEHRLAATQGPDHLHGGRVGFSHVAWQAAWIEEGRSVRLRHRSPAGDEGYPGALDVETVYRLEGDDALAIEWRATTDAPTVVSLSNHAYFDLEAGGAASVLDHVLEIAASRYTPVDERGLPTGAIAAVEGTPLDFRAPRRIGERIDALVAARGGYDHNYALDAAGDLGALAARLVAPRSGRVLEVRTTQPGLQLYTGNFLGGDLRCLGGARPGRWQALCLETQGFPDAPNQPAFPSARLDPGETYRHATVYAFGAA